MSIEYFAAIASLVEPMTVRSSAPELVVTLRDATRRLGADASYLASFVREDRDVDSFRFLVACDPVWSLHYEERDCFAADPWLRYATLHTEPAIAASISVVNEREQQTVDLASRYGFSSAFVVPAPVGRGPRNGVLVLGSKREDFFDGRGLTALRVIARGLAMELHERFAHLLQRELKARCELTDDELELLAHQREGRPTKVIASLLGCSVGAVDQRFHRLYGKLGVANRAQAARLAAAYGLV